MTPLSNVPSPLRSFLRSLVGVSRPPERSELVRSAFVRGRTLPVGVSALALHAALSMAGCGGPAAPVPAADAQDGHEDGADGPGTDARDAVSEPAPDDATDDAAPGDVMPDDALPDDAGLDTPADAADPREPVALRIATWNASLHRAAEGQLAADLAGGEDEHARAIARVLQGIRPDIVLLNEFDTDLAANDPRDAAGAALRVFLDAYLDVSQGEGLEPLRFVAHYIPPTNTGAPSGLDLDRNGRVGDEVGTADYAGDAWGFGTFPGQYGMVLLSTYPIDTARARTFQTFRWSDLPGNRLPADWFGETIAPALRLSSKNHADVVVDVAGRPLHVLISHPTPPAFDGPERRNQLRNHDEIRLWTTYLGGDDDACRALVDDGGVAGCLASDASFVLLGDLNADPFDGNGIRDGIRALLAHERVADPQPRSEGGPEASERDGRANWEHRGDPAFDTADFHDATVGNLRVDYVLPSADIVVTGSGVFWPLRGDALRASTDVSDHYPVWVDVQF